MWDQLLIEILFQEIILITQRLWHNSEVVDALDVNCWQNLSLFNELFPFFLVCKLRCCWINFQETLSFFLLLLFVEIFVSTFKWKFLMENNKLFDSLSMVFDVEYYFIYTLWSFVCCEFAIRFNMKLLFMLWHKLCEHQLLRYHKCVFNFEGLKIWFSCARFNQKV